MRENDNVKILLMYIEKIKSTADNKTALYTETIIVVNEMPLLGRYK